MGLIAGRIGVRWTVMFGAVMSGLGLAVSASGGVWPFLLGHDLLIGLLGSAGMLAPLTIYVSPRRAEKRSAFRRPPDALSRMLAPHRLMFGGRNRAADDFPPI